MSARLPGVGFRRNPAEVSGWWKRRPNGGYIMIDKELLEILACPKCKAEVRLDEGAQRIICTSPTCGLRYPIRDGIPVMLIDEAEAPGGA